MVNNFVIQMIVGIVSVIGLLNIGCYIGKKWGSYTDFFIDVIEIILCKYTDK